MPRPAFVAAFAVVALVAAGGWIVRTRNMALKAKVEELTRRNESLAGRAAEADALRAALEQKSSDASQAAGRSPGAAAPAPEATAAIVLKDRSGDVGLDGEGQLTGLDLLPVAEGRAVAAALRHGKVEVATVTASLALADNVRGHTWTVPRPLRRGATYTWRVSAGRTSGGGAPADGAPSAAPDGAPAAATGAARFRVLDHDEAAALERLLRNTGGSALAAGVFYARAGLLDDAEKELRAVLDANPDSPIAKSIVQNFLEQRVRNSAPAGATR